jgi:hypothetical protein
MHKTRWLLLGLLLACLVGVALVVLALLPSRPGITKENFDRIEEGMTRAEVEAIFGGPANRANPWPNLANNPNEWEDETSGASAIINFDENNRVSSKQWWPDGPDERTVWQKMLDRLPWREKPPRRRPEVLYLLRS